MVMHARNKERLDGYYEKSSYQSSKRDYDSRETSSRSNYGRDRESPLNNGRSSSYRSVTPDCDSPRDRRDRYQSSSYSQKIRDRDYKKDKYDSRSQKRSSYSQKSRDRDYFQETYSGDWSVHMSSSGKKYYYNCKTEVSQWEKPREWVDRERTSSKDTRDRDYSSSYKDRESSRDYREKDVRSERSSDYRGDKDGRGGSGFSSSKSHSNSRSRWPPPSHTDAEQPPSHKRRAHDEAPADMDISPGDSTPTSETSYSHSSTPTIAQPLPHAAGNGEGPILMMNALPRLSSNSGGGGGGCGGSSSSGPPLQNSNHKSQSPQGNGDSVMSNTPGPPSSVSPPVTMAGLPKILSQITGNKQIEQNDLNPQKALQTINNALARSAASGVAQHDLDRHNSPLYTSPHYSALQPSLSQPNLRISDGVQPSGGGGSGDGGPPTPTQELDIEQRRFDSAPTSMSSLQGVMNSSQIGRLQQEPNLAASYLKYMRTDLISHVTNWPAEILERQAQKLSEEAHLLGDLQCSKVSTELKCARSLVRIAEITATLQEQKIMYLRQQLHRLEGLKSQNSFMSDDL